MAEKTGRRLTALTVLALVLALLAGIGIGLLIPKLKDVRLFRGGSVMRCEEKNFSLSQAEFSYYYWTEFYYFQDVYGEYLADAFDPDRPLSEQPYSETQTWEDYMIERALSTARETMAMVFRANEEGFVMRQEAEASLKEVEQNFRDAAKEQGFETLDAYLCDSFGAGAREQSFLTYLTYAHLASDYAAFRKEQIAADEKTVAAYYERHEEAYNLEPEPLEAAKNDYIEEEYRNVYLSITESYHFEVDYKNTAAAITAAAEKEADDSAESVKK